MVLISIWLRYTKISAVPVSGRINVGGVVFSCLSLRYLLWILALVFSWLRSDIRESIGSPQHQEVRGTLGASLNSVLAAIRNPCDC